MKIKLITVGKIKEKFFKDAILEYSKRLSKFCNLEIIEVQDEMTPDKATDVENQKILEKEGDRILSKIKDSDFLITLEIEGKKLSSEDLAKKLSSICLSGQSTIDFVIGGSLGLDKKVKARSDFSLSFSDMTFPHQLMRVIVLEQIYRAFKINANEPYHK
ncbi:MAG: 23S rRNA (pseudouridine(1915)-N(3))-methyltransferase RlmH [Lachnospiraceae bacterium]|nr:23S rRNA (pseudouridine(1915)-N(3))-methyltransferase RlmH [Lachnospiraceae bacterium]